MATLDKTRKYATMGYNSDGISYVQDGKYFNLMGEEVVTAAEKVVEEKEEDNIEDLHWSKLKEMVLNSGGVYTNKQEAIEFLKDK